MGRQTLWSFLIISVSILLFLFGSFTKGAYAMTAEEEKKLGKRVLLEIRKEANFLGDLNVQAFVEKVGYSLVDQLGSTPFEFKFYVINDPDPNSFAVPGGYIFINTGIIVLAENEQEIAGVLAHEISHVTQRHINKMIEKSKALNIATLGAILAGMLAGRGGAGSQATVAMATGTAGALTLKYSREIETDADQHGLNLLIKAGYDPDGMINLFTRLEKLSLAMAPNVPAYLLNHPALESRIALLENLMQIGQKPVGPFKRVGNFKRVQSKAFVEEREPEVAVNYFGSMVKTNPQDVDGIYGLGLAFKKMGRLDKSIDVFQSGLSLSPKDPDLLRELGIVYFLSGKLDQAIENLEAARSVSAPDEDADLLTLYYLGRTYQEKGTLTRALPLFLKVQKGMPEFSDVYYNLGSVYGRMGQNGQSHFNFGKHFKLIGDKQSALLHFRTAYEWFEKGSRERKEVEQEIKEMQDKSS
jgi:predicted Zn-dependent protease